MRRRVRRRAGCQSSSRIMWIRRRLASQYPSTLNNAGSEEPTKCHRKISATGGAIAAGFCEARLLCAFALESLPDAFEQLASEGFPLFS